MFTWLSKSIYHRGMVAFAVGFVLGISSCATVTLDRSVSAADGNARTLFLAGCGQEPLRGRVFCELRQGATPTDIITMYVPTAACKRQTCVSYQVINPDGSFGQAGSVPLGAASVDFTIAELTGKPDPIVKSLDDEWQIAVRVYFTGPDGEEYQQIMRGLVRLAVLTADYKPMGCDDPNVAWEVKPYSKGTCRLQWSSKLRSARCGKCLVTQS